MAWNLIEAVGNHLWQSTLIVAVAVLLTLALRRGPAAVRYGVWLAASLKFLVPFALLVALGRQVEWRAVDETAPSPPEAAIDWGTMLEVIGRPFARPDAGQLVGMISPAPGTAGFATWIPSALLAIWGCGCAMVLLRRHRQGCRMASVVRDATSVADRPLADALHRVGASVGAGPQTRQKRAYRLRTVVSSASSEPCVFGIWRPVLVWPAGMSERLTDAQIDAILAHELAHVRRRDNLLAAVHALVEALFWFHPAVWWIGARLVDERERACDEAVLRQGSEPEVYAQSILQTCRFCLESPLAYVSGVTGSDLGKRIEAIMGNHARQELTVRKRMLLALAGCAAVAAPVAVGVLQAPPLRAQTSETEVIRRTQRALDELRRAADTARQQVETAAQTERQTFEVASVKVNRSGLPRVRVMAQGGQYVAENVQARLLIRTAYRLQDFQVVGGPDWLDTERFDVLGKLPDATGRGDTGLMMQSLLADRFKLVAHTETRELPIYSLVTASTDGTRGPQLRPSAVDCAAMLAAARARGELPAPPQPGQRPPCGATMAMGRLIAGGVTMAQLAQSLSGRVNRVVLDRTGLTGAFDYELEWAPDQFQGAGPLGPLPGQPPAEAPRAPSDGPSLFTALQEQLGLKLESERGPVPVLVIDSIERPMED